jgi:hypothetical protein
LIEELGHGGMGMVYKALHTKLDRVVALKVLTMGRTHDPRAITRFEREMKAVGKLDHHQIVRAYDAREIDGTPVLVMEYIEGLDLAAIVRRLGALPVCDACAVVKKAATALQYVHEHGLVHRDVKPSNLMLTPQGEIKLLDLGLARFHLDQSPGDRTTLADPKVCGEVTGANQAMGTADYMAPEQISNSRASDIRADIYSLGCTLYKLLTAHAPFDDGHHPRPAEKMAAHANEVLPSIRQANPQVPEGLANVLGRMLAKSPSARFAIPADVAEALTPYTNGADLPGLLSRAQVCAPACPESSASDDVDRRFDEPRISINLAASGRRRRGIWLVALALLTLGGAGLWLGVLITIKRGTQHTRVTVPEGADVTIADSGAVDVKLPATNDQSLSLLDEQPPVVVETFPVSGAADVAPGEIELRVRFSKEMTDGSWTWSTAWEDSTPDIIDTPHYQSDGRTCVVKAKLKPGRTYAFWLNSANFQNFIDRSGRPAIPYLLIFQTKPK